LVTIVKYPAKEWQHSTCN